MTAIDPITIDSIDEALALVERGIPVFPVRLSAPDANGKREKTPATRHGHLDATADAETIREWWRRNPNAAVGVPTGQGTGLMALDVDPDGENWAAQNVDMLMAANRIHYTERGRHYVFQHAEGVRNSESGIAPGVDVRGEGGWIVWWPARGLESHGEIEEAGPAPDALIAKMIAAQGAKERAPDVPDTIPEGQRDSALTSLAGTLRRRGLDQATIRAMLEPVNATCEPPKSSADLDRIAASVSRYEPSHPLVRDAIHNGEFPDGESHIEIPEVEIGDLEHVDVPAPEFVVEPILPRGVVSLLGAHGGTGKTILALIQSTCVASGVAFMGYPVERVPVIFFSAEDNGSKVRWRLKWICRALGVDPSILRGWLTVYDVTTLDPALYREISEGGTRLGIETPMRRALAERVARKGAGLLVVDNASDTYEANENERSKVRGFMRSLQRIAIDNDAAVELIAHVDKATARKSDASSESYSGSTAWHNSARSRLFLYEKDQALVLEHQKSNFGPRAEPLHMAWQNGVPVLTAPASTGVDPITRGMHKRAVLDLLTEFYDRGEHIPTSHHAPGNAWKVLSGEAGFPSDLDKSGLQSLLRDMERAGEIEREEYVNAHRKTRERWHVTDQGLESLGSASSASS